MTGCPFRETASRRLWALKWVFQPGPSGQTTSTFSYRWGQAARSPCGKCWVWSLVQMGLWPPEPTAVIRTQDRNNHSQVSVFFSEKGSPVSQAGLSYLCICGCYEASDNPSCTPCYSFKCAASCPILCVIPGGPTPRSLHTRQAFYKLWYSPRLWTCSWNYFFQGKCFWEVRLLEYTL